MEPHEVSKMIFNTLSGLSFDLKNHWAGQLAKQRLVNNVSEQEFAKGVIFGVGEMFALITSLRAELKPQFEGTVPKIDAQPTDSPETPNAT